MNRNLLTLAKDAVHRARSHGAAGARAQVTRSRGSSVEWRNGKLDRIRESTSLSLSIALYVDGRFSSNQTSDLRPEALDAFLAETVAMTRLLEADPHRKLPDPRYYQGLFQGDLGLYDPEGAASVTALDRRRTAKELEEGTRSAPGAEAILTCSTTSSDNLSEDALVTSNGMEAESRGTGFSLSSVVSVRDQGNRRPQGFWYGASLKRADLPSCAAIGHEALRRTLRDVGGRPEPSGEYPCVCENVVAGRLLRNLLSPLQGPSLDQGRSIFLGQIGKEVVSPKLTVRDDPHLVGGFGSTAYDLEGMATRPFPVFERGVLRNYYLGTYYASKLGMEPTTVNSTNLLFDQGTSDPAGLLRTMGRGILITSFLGGNSNDSTGDFSIGVKGQWIENGEPVRAIAEMNLAGNHKDFWKHLEETGNDPHPYSATRVPSLRFAPVQFSGV